MVLLDELLTTEPLDLVLLLVMSLGLMLLLVMLLDPVLLLAVLLISATLLEARLVVMPEESEELVSDKLSYEGGVKVLSGAVLDSERGTFVAVLVALAVPPTAIPATKLSSVTGLGACGNALK